MKAMVPAEEPETMVGQHYEHRSAGQTGVMCTNIRKALPDEMNKCGIYEWKARGLFVGQPDGVVVYVGSTCRAIPGALRDRILEYCTDGSHKPRIINDALQRGYELCVRVKTSGRNSDRSRKTAENRENELLERYDYAWNFRNNGKTRIRQILR